MRYATLLFGMMLLSGLLIAQERIVVNTTGEVMRIGNNGSASALVHERVGGRKIINSSPSCSSQRFSNRPTGRDDAVVSIGHQDCCAVWFEAPANGVIDSMFIFIDDDTNSTGEGGNLLFRLFRSNINSTNGPGHQYPYGSGHYIAPPNICWGYYNCTNDLDGHIAPFADDASGPDTTWHSTYNLNNDSASIAAHYGEIVDTTMKSFCPTGAGIWGIGPIPAPIHANTITGIDLTSLGCVPVNKGDAFFLIYKVPGSHPAGWDGNVAHDPNLVTVRAENNDMPGDSSYAARNRYHNWTFYEHARYCAPGWVASGDMNVYIWYSMKVTSNTPPRFVGVEQLGATTIETQDRTVTAEIEDCNVDSSDRAGVMNATLHYAVAGEDGYYGPETNVPMAMIGGAIWSADIPKQPAPSTVRYYLTASDSENAVSTSDQFTYRVLSLFDEQMGVGADTGATATSGSIAAIGTSIDTSAFFLPFKSSGLLKDDDGTAGPFPIGNFAFFGDTMHFAWVGVNGGIALSKTADDTIDVNADGEYYSWPLPAAQRLSHGDTMHRAGVPRNFIAGFWADLVYGDATGQYGHIRHYNDSSRFVVEWDSVRLAGNPIGGYLPGDQEATFRIVLNKQDRSIEVQYDHIDFTNFDSLCLVGLMTDVLNPLQLHGSFLLNRNMEPAETAPRNSWTIKFWMVAPIYAGDGWNMISFPGPLQHLFFHPLSRFFAFEPASGYVVTSLDSLRPGRGYWVKFAGARTVYFATNFLDHLDIPVKKGFNMIGPINKPIASIDIINNAEPPTLIGSQFFEYSGGYNTVSILMPGRSYWVKATDAGVIHMNTGPAMHGKAAPVVDEMRKMNQITIASKSGTQRLYLTAQESLQHGADYYDMPPTPPQGAFDARFATGRMVESYPAQGTATSEYTIEVHLTTFPVTVSWNIVSAPEGRTFTMSDADNGKVLGKVALNGTGSIKIDANVKTLVLKAEAGINVPTRFDLSQNYPNPFNPTTDIGFRISDVGFVTLKVFDLLGQEVATLVNERKAPGEYHVQWNAAGMPSGVYFYRLNAAGEGGKALHQIKKMMVVK